MNYMTTMTNIKDRTHPQLRARQNHKTTSRTYGEAARNADILGPDVAKRLHGCRPQNLILFYLDFFLLLWPQPNLILRKKKLVKIFPTYFFFKKIFYELFFFSRFALLPFFSFLLFSLTFFYGFLFLSFLESAR
jgi:hypothetical protein